MKRVMQKVVLYTHIDKEQLRNKGEQLGMEDDALKNFMYFEEVKISVWVDTQTGAVSDVKIA